jgi:hypothetical protein
LAAVVVQVLLPFLIAGEIRLLTRYPFLFATYDPASICGHALAGGGGHRGSPVPAHRDIGACPLCTALAATHAVAPPAPPILPLPCEAVAFTVAVPAPSLPGFRHYGSYEARGPPARA